MTKQYYECHVTCLGTPEEVKPHVEFIGWTFSAIDGDPDFGPGIKCYATHHYNFRHTTDDVMDWVSMAAQTLRKFGIKVIREKVELVIYDIRSK